MLNLKHYFVLGILLISNLSFAADTAPNTQSTSSNKVIDPVKMLNDSAQETIVQIKQVRAQLKTPDNAPTPFPAVYKIINLYLLPEVDLAAISERTLGRTFNQATLAEQHHFMEAYKTLLINTYGVVLAQYKDLKVQFFKVRGGYQDLNQVNVNSQFIFTDRDPIKITYTLILDKKDSKIPWKVIDMSVEGVSLLESFKSQFIGEIQKGGMKQLLETLDTHNKKVAAKINAPQQTTEKNETT
jgi:phospholipid transport system substrate-binding protein